MPFKITRILVRLSNQRGYKNTDASALLRDARQSIIGEAKMGNLRVSGRAIEFDMFADSREIVEQELKPILKRVGPVLQLKPLDGDEEGRTDSQIVEEGVSFFNEERFWESHEVLEQIWKSKRGDERTLLQGIILTTIAFVHHQKAKPNICISVLKRALKKLEGAKPIYRGIQISTLKEDANRIVSSGSIKPFKLITSSSLKPQLDG